MSKALDDRINFRDVFASMGNKLKNILASTMTPEEKLERILMAMARDVQEKRATARKIGTQMRAMADPETPEMEPLEMLRAREARLVELGGSLYTQMQEAETAGHPRETSNIKVRMGQVAQELTGLREGMLATQQSTYETLVSSYEIAMQSLSQVEAAYQTARANGPAMLTALRAHEEAMALRKEAQAGSGSPDMKFMDDLAAELSAAKAEMRADQAIDEDLNAMNPTVDKMLADLDQEAVDANVMAEFEAASKK